MYLYTYIRRALAQGVSDHGPLDINTTTTSTMTSTLTSIISKTTKEVVSTLNNQHLFQHFLFHQQEKLFQQSTINNQHLQRQRQKKDRNRDRDRDTCPSWLETETETETETRQRQRQRQRHLSDSIVDYSAQTMGGLSGGLLAC